VAEVVAVGVSEELDEHGLATLVATRLAGLLDTSSAGVVRFELGVGTLTVIGHAGERPLPEPIPLSAPTASTEVARTGHFRAGRRGRRRRWDQGDARGCSGAWRVCCRGAGGDSWSVVGLRDREHA
jgi:hypothetical protein